MELAHEAIVRSILLPRHPYKKLFETKPRHHADMATLSTDEIPQSKTSLRAGL